MYVCASVCTAYVYIRVCVYTCTCCMCACGVCVCIHVCVCVRACAHACVRVCMSPHCVWMVHVQSYIYAHVRYIPHLRVPLIKMMSLSHTSLLTDEFKIQKKRPITDKNTLSVSAETEQDSSLQPLSVQPVQLRRDALSLRIQSNPLSPEFLQWKEKVLREARASLLLQSASS